MKHILFTIFAITLTGAKTDACSYKEDTGDVMSPESHGPTSLPGRSRCEWTAHDFDMSLVRSAASCDTACPSWGFRSALVEAVSCNMCDDVTIDVVPGVRTCDSVVAALEDCACSGPGFRSSHDIATTAPGEILARFDCDPTPIECLLDAPARF